MKRAGIRRRSPMARGTKKMRPVSKRRTAMQLWVAAVYREVDARSGGRCEVTLDHAAIIAGAGEGGAAFFICPRDSVWAASTYRCLGEATDHAHLRKPRLSRANHTAALIFHACRRCHERQGEAQPYAKGRIVVTPHGDGTFTFRLVFADNKFALR